MATRATYQVNKTVFYCHWDGYPTGAAHRFANMVAACTVIETGTRKDLQSYEDRRGGLEYAFIRGNMDAEPAWENDHEGHGDTEWRYTVTEDKKGRATLKCEARIGFTDEWKLHSEADLAEWINKTRESEWQTPRIVRAEMQSGRSIYATEDTARALEGREDELAARFDDSNPNRKSHLQQAQIWAKAAAGVYA